MLYILLKGESFEKFSQKTVFANNFSYLNTFLYNCN